MSKENQKDFNEMLHDSKDMPKMQTITDQKSMEKYGGNKMFFAPPIDYDKVMRQIPFGKVITVEQIRTYFAGQNGADFTEPMTAGIFVSIAAWASFQRAGHETPYWRMLKAKGELKRRRKSWKRRGIALFRRGRKTSGTLLRIMKNPSMNWTKSSETAQRRMTHEQYH